MPATCNAEFIAIVVLRMVALHPQLKVVVLGSKLGSLQGGPAC